MKNSDYNTAIKCMRPDLERKLSFLGDIASGLTAIVSGNGSDWQQIAFESTGLNETEIIECRVENLIMSSYFDIISEWVPNIPGLNKVLCTEADIYVKARYKVNGEYKTVEEMFHVKRYGADGWRIETDTAIN